MRKGESSYDPYQDARGFILFLAIPLPKKDIMISTLQISKLR